MFKVVLNCLGMASVELNVVDECIWVAFNKYLQIGRINLYGGDQKQCGVCDVNVYVDSCPYAVRALLL